MYTRTKSSAATSPHRFPRWRPVGYWLATAVVAGELGLGGIWDITRLPYDGEADRYFDPNWLCAG